MVEYEGCILSESIFTEEFVCNLSKCKGACCVEGDAGAPLTEEEVDIIDAELETYLPYLPEKGRKAIEEGGSFTIDQDGEFVTQLVDGKECAFTHFDDKGNAFCGIEMAWKDGKTNFRKPISCHLYPVRVAKFHDGKKALNYHEWNICSDACSLGKELKVPVYKFVKEPLERAFGKEWVAGLDEVKVALEEYYEERDKKQQ